MFHQRRKGNVKRNEKENVILKKKKRESDNKDHFPSFRRRLPLQLRVASMLISASLTLEPAVVFPPNNISLNDINLLFFFSSCTHIDLHVNCLVAELYMHEESTSPKSSVVKVLIERICERRKLLDEKKVHIFFSGVSEICKRCRKNIPNSKLSYLDLWCR